METTITFNSTFYGCYNVKCKYEVSAHSIYNACFRMLQKVIKPEYQGFW